MSDRDELLEAVDNPAGADAGNKWAALAVVVTPDGSATPVHVLQEGDANGVSVLCRVITGPFLGADVRALVGHELGGGFKSRSIRAGQRVLLQFLDGTANGTIIATHSVAGGADDPIPKAVAGSKVEEEELQRYEIDAPPKGVGRKVYIRGMPYVIRLKGAEDGFAGELYIEADDAKDSADGNGTFIRIVRDAASGTYAVKARDATGAGFEAHLGVASLFSPDGQNRLQVSNKGCAFAGVRFDVNADLIKLNGQIQANVQPGVPPTPVMAVLRGTSGASAVPSVSFVVGT